MTILERCEQYRHKIIRIVSRKFYNTPIQDIEELWNDLLWYVQNRSDVPDDDNTLQAHLTRRLSQKCVDRIRRRHSSDDVCDHLWGSLSDENVVIKADEHQASIYRGLGPSNLELADSYKRYQYLLSFLIPAHRRLAEYVLVEGNTRENAAIRFGIPYLKVKYILDRVIKPTLRLAVKQMEKM